MPDGVPLTWVGRLRGHRIERVCGLDVLPDLADRGRTVGLRHFFYGGDEARGAAAGEPARTSISGDDSWPARRPRRSDR